jgi:hypothetical protein
VDSIGRIENQALSVSLAKQVQSALNPVIIEVLAKDNDHIRMFRIVDDQELSELSCAETDDRNPSTPKKQL